MSRGYSCCCGLTGRRRESIVLEGRIQLGWRMRLMGLLVRGPILVLLLFPRTAAPDCTPGYYNNEGRDPGPAAALAVGYPLGAHAYFEYIDKWRQSGAFEGLTFA